MHGLHLPLNTKADLYPPETRKRRMLVCHLEIHIHIFLINTCLPSSKSAEVSKTLRTCFNLLKSSSPHLTTLLAREPSL